MIRFASTNPIKLAEAREIIPGIEAVALDLPEIQSTDPRVVVRHKLMTVAALNLDAPVIVEDTGLAIDAWDGLPGALIKWFVDGWGAEALVRRSQAAGRGCGAEAMSAVGVLDQGRSEVWWDAIRGCVVAPRGDLGGWTSIFEVTGHGKTLAEMPFAERMSVTMRRGPLLKARDWLLKVSRAPRSDGAAMAAATER